MSRHDFGNALGYLVDSSNRIVLHQEMGEEEIKFAF